MQRDESVLPPLLELRRLGPSAREAIAVVQSGQDDVCRPATLAARGDEHPQHLEKPGRGGGSSDAEEPFNDPEEENHLVATAWSGI